MSLFSANDRDSSSRWSGYLAAALVLQGAVALLARGGLQHSTFILAAPLEMELVASPGEQEPSGGGGGAPPSAAQSQTAIPIQPTTAPMPPHSRLAETPSAPQPVAQAVSQPKPEPGHAPIQASAKVATTAAPVVVAEQGGGGGSNSRAPTQASQGGGTPATGGRGGGGGTVTQARPNYLHNPAPPYPPLARRRGLTGRVILKVRVGSDGLAREVGIRASSGHAVLDQAAASTVTGWRFSPARRGETPLESWVDVPINFELKGGERG